MTFWRSKPEHESKRKLWDNSPTERFFHSLKHEQLNYKFIPKEQVTLSIIDYLAFYNEVCTYSKLGYQSPLEFEQIFYRKTP